MVETDTPEVVLSVIVLTGISNRFSARCWRRDLWHPIGLTDEDQTISIVPQAIQSRGAEEFVSGEGLVPFLEGQIASDYVELESFFGGLTSKSPEAPVF